jgi:hypothetical protein
MHPTNKAANTSQYALLGSHWHPADIADVDITDTDKHKRYMVQL